MQRSSTRLRTDWLGASSSFRALPPRRAWKRKRNGESASATRPPHPLRRAKIIPPLLRTSPCTSCTQRRSLEGPAASHTPSSPAVEPAAVPRKHAVFSRLLSSDRRPSQVCCGLRCVPETQRVLPGLRLRQGYELRTFSRWSHSSSGDQQLSHCTKSIAPNETAARRDPRAGGVESEARGFLR